jgi:large subunit ribosomal protein L10
MKSVKREEKVKMVEELHDRFRRAKATVLTKFQGLTVPEMEALRKHLRASEVEYKVVKNTLAEKAAEGTDVVQATDRLVGPIGIAWGYKDPVTPVKALSEFIRKQKGFELVSGVLEGKLLGPRELKEVALLPSREVMIGKMLGSVRSPLFGLAGALQGIQRKLVYVLNAVKESKAAQA